MIFNFAKANFFISKHCYNIKYSSHYEISSSILLIQSYRSILFSNMTDSSQYVTLPIVRKRLETQERSFKTMVQMFFKIYSLVTKQRSLGHSTFLPDRKVDNQSFEVLLNNFARLTNSILEECPTFALFKSGFRLQLLFIAFKI